MTVSIRCGIKVNGIRKQVQNQCTEPKYTRKLILVKGCPLWDECQRELKTEVEVYEDVPTAQEIEQKLYFLDINDEKKIWRKK